MVFQDPFSSLNPRHSIGRIVGEPLRTHGISSRGDTSTRVQELLPKLGRLKLEIPEKNETLKITLNGIPLRPAQIQSALSVDPGEYTIKAELSGFQPTHQLDQFECQQEGATRLRFQPRQRIHVQRQLLELRPEGATLTCIRTGQHHRPTHEAYRSHAVPGARDDEHRLHSGAAR